MELKCLFLLAAQLIDFLSIDLTKDYPNAVRTRRRCDSGLPSTETWNMIGQS